MSNPCKTEECRVQMIREMYKAIEGTELLLDQIQEKPDLNNPIVSMNGVPKPESLKNAFKTLIATVLSVRSKDETTMKVTEKLWKVYSSPQELADAPIETLEELVHSSGTYRQKAKRIKEIGKIIHETYHDQVPQDREQLLALPGVGRKVANCVLVFSFNKPAIPVDTHVHRISNRTGWVKTKNPDKTEIELEKLFPLSIWSIMNYTLVSFGKKICKPITPDCRNCPVENRCAKLIMISKKNPILRPKSKKEL